MRRWLVLILLIFGTVPVAAQQPCGQGIPCRPPAWELPQFPELISPTPLVVEGAGNVIPTNTPTITPTYTPMQTSTAIPTFTPFLDTVPLEDKIATIQAIYSGTDIPILNASGTPEVLEDKIAGIGASAETYIGYLRTVEQSNMLGPFTPLMTMLSSGIVVVLLFKVTTFILPIGAALVGIIRKIVSVILDFLPL